MCRSAVTATAPIAIGQSGRQGCGCKLRDGERHGAEELAGIVGLGADTLLVGNDEVGRMDEILCRTHQPHQREDAERDHQAAAIIPLATTVMLVAMIVVMTMLVTMTAAQRGGEASRDGRRHVAGAATTANGLVAGRLQHADTEDDGIYRLDHGGGQATFLVAGLGLGAEAGGIYVGAEDGHAGIATKQHDLLFQHGDAIKFLGATGTDAPLQNEFDVEANVDGVKAAVELNGIDADIRPGDRGTLDTDLAGVLDDILAEVGEEHAHVLVTVAVAAGVHDAVGLHAHAPRLGLTPNGGDAMIRHENTSIDAFEQRRYRFYLDAGRAR